MPLTTRHVSFTVSDLQRSLDFYHGLLGLRVVRVQERTGPDIARQVGLEGARLKIAFLELPETGGLLLELIEYVAPPGRPATLHVNSPGAAHLCFETDDIWATSQHLRAHGVHFRTEPTRIEEGIYRGSCACYFLDPDGIAVELAQYTQADITPPNDTPGGVDRHEGDHAPAGTGA